MVVGHLAEIEDRLAAALEARPADKPPWTALRRAMDAHPDELDRDAEAKIATALMLAARELRARRGLGRACLPEHRHRRMGTPGRYRVRR
jgi:hypothetical protein